MQLKGTELRQLRKLECNKEEMSKIVVDPLKIKEDKAGPTVDIGDPLNEKLELISRFRNFFLPPAQERNQSLKEELQRLDLEEEKERQAEIRLELSYFFLLLFPFRTLKTHQKSAANRRHWESGWRPAHGLSHWMDKLHLSI